MLLEGAAAGKPASGGPSGQAGGTRCGRSLRRQGPQGSAPWVLAPAARRVEPCLLLPRRIHVPRPPPRRCGHQPRHRQRVPGVPRHARGSGGRVEAAGGSWALDMQRGTVRAVVAVRGHDVGGVGQGVPQPKWLRRAAAEKSCQGFGASGLGHKGGARGACVQGDRLERADRGDGQAVGGVPGGQERGLGVGMGAEAEGGGAAEKGDAGAAETGVAAAGADVRVREYDFRCVQYEEVRQVLPGAVRPAQEAVRCTAGAMALNVGQRLRMLSAWHRWVGAVATACTTSTSSLSCTNVRAHCTCIEGAWKVRVICHMPWLPYDADCAPVRSCMAMFLAQVRTLYHNVYIYRGVTGTCMQ